MNRKLKGLSLIVVILLYATGCVSNSLTVSYKGSISPNVYGLQQAKTGEERYEILLRTHKEAVQKGLTIDYRGVDTINLTIPKGAESIPLGPINDFNGVVFNVTNQNQDVFLFSYVNKSEPVEVPAHLIDKGLFLEIPRLNSGKKLLIIEDQNPWVENRKGYSYGHIRKDILLLKQGKAQNHTIMPYDNPQSLPKCKVYDLDIPCFKIENLVLNRNDNSSYKTFLCNIVGTNNVQINHVTINTPQSGIAEDMAINIVDCTNVSFDNVSIYGTYSRSDYSGYGVLMNNIWNFRVDNMYGHGNWGVFGTNNISKTKISNSDINRYDIHCYGKDVSFDHVTFRNRYNQFSGVYGTIRFDKCSFENFIPIINGTSYNAYVSYDLIFNNCDYYTDHDTPLIVDGGCIGDEVNNRRELSERCLPNVTIRNFTFHIPNETQNVYLFFFRDCGGTKRKMGYVSYINVKGLKAVYKDGLDRDPAGLVISNKNFDPENRVKETYKNNDLMLNVKRIW